jgi:hypothetical protein
MTNLTKDLRASHGLEGAILLHIGSGQLFSVNSVGSRILQLLETGATKLQINERISHEFGADEESVRKDVDEFLAHLAQHGIVTEKNDMQDEQAKFRIIVLRLSSSEILVSGEHSQVVLPVVSIQRHTRPAEQIVGALHRLLNLESYCLFTLAQQVVSNSVACYAVVSTVAQDAIPPTGFRWAAVDRLAEEAFIDAADYHSTKQMLQDLRGEATHSASGFFARPGWLEEIMNWAQDQLSPAGLRLTRKFEQLNASPTFSLLRLATDGPAVWLKAVGEPNIREFFISQELARLFPEFVPGIFGARQDCKAWLTLDVEGRHPDADSTPKVWERAAGVLARLENSSAGLGLHLIDRGFKDIRTDTLRRLVRPFLEVMGALMECQPGYYPKPMSWKELEKLGEQTEEWLSDFDDLSLPNVVVHLDFNPGNIIVSETGCVFLDWAEAGIGPCFLTLQFLLEHLRKWKSHGSAEESAAISGYANAWLPFIGSESFADALLLAPFVAVTSYALGMRDWQCEKRRSDPLTASHLRSLTRRMKREADALSERKMACRR